MADQTPLDLVITANPDGALGALKAVDGQVVQVGQDGSGAGTGLGAAFKAGQQGSESLRGSILETRREITQETRTASMMGRVLSQMGMGGNEAVTAFTRLGVAISMGGGIGLAIAAAEALVTIYHKLTEGSAELSTAILKSDAEWKKLTVTLESEVVKAFNAVQIAQEELASSGSANTSKARVEMLTLGQTQKAELEKEVESLREAEGKIRTARARISESENAPAAFAGPELAAGQHDLDMAEQAKRAAEARIRILSATQDRIAGETATKIGLQEQHAQELRDDEFLDEADQKIEADKETRRKAAVAAAKAEVEREARAHLQSLEDTADAETTLRNKAEAGTLAVDNARIEREIAEAPKALARARALELAKNEITKRDDPTASAAAAYEIETRYAALELDLVRGNADEEARIRDASALRTIKADKSVMDAQRAATTANIALLRSVGTTIGNIMSDVSKTGAQKWQEMAKAGITAIIDLCTTQVEAYAVSSAGAAFFAEAGIPIVGPLIAAGAAVAAGVAVRALLSQMPSAATGWQDVPHDTLVNIHKGETIVPAYDSAEVRAGLNGGGGTTNITISAVDSAGFEAMLRRNGDALGRVTRDIARRRV